MTDRREVNRLVRNAAAGICLGALAVSVLVLVGVRSEVPDEPVAKTHGVVYRKLGADCDIADRALLKRLYGNGKATPSGVSGDDTNSRCTWSRKAIDVELIAHLDVNPAGGEVTAAVESYRRDRTVTEEGDPVHGLPEPLTGLGDEAFAEYDPKDGSARLTEVEARRGNAVLSVRVHDRRKDGVVGRGAALDAARRTAAAVLARLS